MTELENEYFTKYGNNKFGNAYFTENDPRDANYIKYSRYRYYLRQTYNTCRQNINGPENAEAISETLAGSKTALEKASRGIGGETIVWEDTLAVVPEGSAAITAWSAALKTEYPGVWTIYKGGHPSYMKFGAFITVDLSSFTDASDISAWAEPAMKWANAAGLITGRTATTLAPEGSASRAEVAAILIRFIEGFVK